MKITLFKILQTLIAMKVYQCKDKILKINIEVQVMYVIDLTRYFFKSQYYLYFFSIWRTSQYNFISIQNSIEGKKKEK